MQPNWLVTVSVYVPGPTAVGVLVPVHCTVNPDVLYNVVISVVKPGQTFTNVSLPNAGLG